MLILVLASNALLLFIGWEGVGLVSYLLIGYFYTRPQAAKAATKAFIINRIGDAGLLLGMLLTLYTIGTTDFETINQAQIDPVTLTWITMLFLVGAVGKSAQLPLYTWLPDAMEGPTPVSALIHAATMVTAGVYLIVRLHPIYLEAPITLQVVGIIGASTALFAALCAIGQWDLKRVLAYSTVSQLGLMFLALGAGAFYSAMFHLTTHAFIKATLFLSAGNVLYAMNGSTNMWKMGGLAKKLKKTHWFFLIGVLAMSGIPPLAAFFSKELILEQEYLAGFVFLFYIAVISSVLTGFYLTRAYVLTFLGKPNLDEKLFKNIHEAPKTMIWTVAILSLLSIFGGFIGCSNCELPNFLNDIGLSMAEKKAEATGFEFSFESLSALFAGMLGMVAAFFIYLRYQDKPLAILENSFYVNELYHALFVKPLKAISKGFNAFLEPAFFEGSVDEVSKATLSIAEKLRKVQGGEIR
ncbi:MAG: NADH-quinone oxidoreductase subunit L, partial [Parachlamydiaceae bacterium]